MRNTWMASAVLAAGVIAASTAGLLGPHGPRTADGKPDFTGK